MVTVEITHEESVSGVMAPEHLEAAVTAIRKDGFVVLEDVVDLDPIAVLRDKAIEDVAALMAREDAPYSEYPPRQGGSGGS